jgi:WD40 repeat protein
VTVWDTSSAEKRCFIQNPQSPLGVRPDIDLVAVSDDGAVVATVNSDATAMLWDSRTGKPLSRPGRFDRTLMEVSILSPANVLVGISSDGFVDILKL